MAETLETDGSNQAETFPNSEDATGGTDHVMDNEPDGAAGNNENEQQSSNQEGRSMDTDRSDEPPCDETPKKPMPTPIELPEYERNVAPKVNCPEKIIVAIDMTSEVNSTSFIARSAPERTMFLLLKKAIRTFVKTKAKINPKHEYALAVLEKSAAVFHQFTNESEEICQALEHLKPSDGQPFDSFDLGSLVEVVKDLVQLPVVEDIKLPPPYIVRVVILYSRSHVMPSLSDQGVQELIELLQSPYFFLDLLYTHEKPSEENYCEAIYDQFCDLDQHEMGYMLEVSRSTTRLFDHMAKLVAHPLQRISQRHTHYKLTKQTDEEVI